MTGSFLTSCETKVKLKLPKHNATAHMFASFHITSQISNYNVIFGQDLLRGLEINLDFQDNFIGWKETNIPMKSLNYKVRIHFIIQESKNIKSVTNRIEQILNDKYEMANLKDVINKLKKNQIRF